jgi:KRAB domain-containing zinc finger protein
MIFTDHINLKKHQLTHQAEDGEFKCDQCPFVTDQFANLTRHLKLATHGEKKIIKTYKTRKPSFGCEFCEKSFFSQKHLKIHASIHPEYKGEKIEQQELERHKSIHDEIKPFPCDLCPYSSLTKGRLREHTMIHHPDSLPEDMTKIFICEICSKSFGCKSYLSRHVSREHTRDKVYNCDQCNYETTQCTAFKEHVRTHTGERPYACHVCTKTFIRSSHMKKHIKEVHIGEKNIFCELCPKTYKTQDQLNQHMVTHTGEKNFHCDVCPKSFGLRSTLANHKRLHTGERPWACDECGLTFSQRGHLYSHKKSHNKNREYAFKCDICPKVFDKAIRLKKHKEKKHIDTDEKPFLCSLCGQEFTEDVHLKAHMKGKHSHLISQESELPSEKSFFKKIWIVKV